MTCFGLRIQNIIRMIKGRTRWAGHVVHIEEVHTGYWSENVKGRGYIWKPRLRIESSGELL
jgi:hypothetical protein